MRHAVLIDKELCSGCKACIEICPRDCIKFDNDNKAIFDSLLCHSCGHCISVCPESAISHESYPFDEYSLIKESLDLTSLQPEALYYFLKSIRSTRKYKTKHVPKEILEKLIDLTRFAPSGHHAQNVEMTVVNDPTVIQQLIDESKLAIKSILKKLDSSFFAFLAFLIGKGAKVREGRKSRARFARMLHGFEEGNDYLFHGAPVVVIFHAKKQSTVPAENCAIASTYFRILAESYRLGSCHIGYIVHYAKYNHKIPQILKIPKGDEIFQAVIVGYPKYTFQRFIVRNPSKVSWVQNTKDK